MQSRATIPALTRSGFKVCHEIWTSLSRCLILKIGQKRVFHVLLQFSAQDATRLISKMLEKQKVLSTRVCFALLMFVFLTFLLPRVTITFHRRALILSFNVNLVHSFPDNVGHEARHQHPLRFPGIVRPLRLHRQPNRAKRRRRLRLEFSSDFRRRSSNSWRNKVLFDTIDHRTTSRSDSQPSIASRI